MQFQQSAEHVTNNPLASFSIPLYTPNIKMTALTLFGTFVIVLAGCAPCVPSCSAKDCIEAGLSFKECRICNQMCK